MFRLGHAEHGEGLPGLIRSGHLRRDHVLGNVPSGSQGPRLEGRGRESEVTDVQAQTMVAPRLLDRRAELTEAVLVASDVEARRVLLPGVAGPLEQTDRFATVRDRFGDVRPAVERQPGETLRLLLAPDVSERSAQLAPFRV